MAESDGLYETLTKKLEFIENCIKLSACPDSFKQEFEERLTYFQTIIDEIQQLATDNSQMKDSLLGKLKKLQENRKRIEEVRKLREQNGQNPIDINVISNTNVQIPANGLNLPFDTNISNRRPIELSPMIEQRNETNILPRRISFERVMEIAYVEAEEYETIPQYMRGRQKLEALNKFIKKINDIVEEKYCLLRMPRSQVPKDKVKLYGEYKRLQGTMEKHVIFVTPSDLGFKILDKQTTNFLAMLRHIKRIKESRDAGLTKICLINNEL